MPDSSLSAIIIKSKLQGVWAGPDESYYFRFKGDSVKEWEQEGTDSALKPYCNFLVSDISCDTLSSIATDKSGFYLLITCASPDNDEVRCYYIISINASEFKIGFKGKYDESGHLKKIKTE